MRIGVSREQRARVHRRRPKPRRRARGGPHFELVRQAPRGQRIVDERPVAGGRPHDRLAADEFRQERVQAAFDAAKIRRDARDVIQPQQRRDHAPSTFLPDGRGRSGIAARAVVVGLEPAERLELLVSLVVAVCRSRFEDLLVGEIKLLIDELQAFGGFHVIADGVAEQRRPSARRVERLRGVESGRVRSLGKVAGVGAGSDVKIGDQLARNGVGHRRDGGRGGVERGGLGAGDRARFQKLRGGGGQHSRRALEGEVGVNVMFGGDVVLEPRHELIARVLVLAVSDVQQAVAQVGVGGLEREQEVQHALEVQGRRVVTRLRHVNRVSVCDPGHGPRADVCLVDLAVVDVVGEAERVRRLQRAGRQVIEIQVAHGVERHLEIRNRMERVGRERRDQMGDVQQHKPISVRAWARGHGDDLRRRIEGRGAGGIGSHLHARHLAARGRYAKGKIECDPGSLAVLELEHRVSRVRKPAPLISEDRARGRGVELEHVAGPIRRLQRIVQVGDRARHRRHGGPACRRPVFRVFQHLRGQVPRMIQEVIQLLQNLRRGRKISRHRVDDDGQRVVVNETAVLEGRGVRGCNVRDVERIGGRHLEGTRQPLVGRPVLKRGEHHRRAGDRVAVNHVHGQRARSGNHARAGAGVVGVLDDDGNVVFLQILDVRLGIDAREVARQLQPNAQVGVGEPAGRQGREVRAGRRLGYGGGIKHGDHRPRRHAYRTPGRGVPAEASKRRTALIIKLVGAREDVDPIIRRRLKQREAAPAHGLRGRVLESVQQDVARGKTLRRKVDGKSVRARRGIWDDAHRRIDHDVFDRRLRQRRKVRSRNEATLRERRRGRGRDRVPLPSAHRRGLARIEPGQRLLHVAPEIAGVVVFNACHARLGVRCEVPGFRHLTPGT